MVVISIELWPQGDPTHRRSLGLAHIENDGSGDASTGNYKVTLFGFGERAQVWKVGRVEGFKRLKLGGWDLLYRALKACVGERNPEA